MSNIVLGIMLRATDEASKVFDQVEAESKRLKEGTLRHSREIGMGMTIMGGSIVAIGAMSAKSFSEFDAGMRKVNSMMLLSEKEFEAYSKEVRELAHSLGIDAVQATEGLYQAISAGVPKENSIEFLEVASKAAIAGVTDTSVAVDGLTTVINAFKIPVEDAQGVADVMFATVKGGKTTFEELSAYMSQVAPVAASMGVSFEDISAATATLTKQGTKTSQAMTQIRASLVSLTKPSEDMAVLLEKMGYSSGEAALETLGYAGTMEALRVAANGNNEVLARAFGSVEGLNAALGVSGQNAEMAAADIDAMTHATDGLGAATEAFDVINEGSDRQWAQLMATVNEIKLVVGDQVVPVLLVLGNHLKGVINWVITWMEENPILAKTLMAITGTLGVLMAVLGPFIIILPQIVAGFKAFMLILPLLKAKMVAFGATMTTTTGIIGIAAAAVMAIVLAMEHFKKKTGEIMETNVVLAEKTLPQLNNMYEILAGRLANQTEGTESYRRTLEELKNVEQAITQVEGDRVTVQAAAMASNDEYQGSLDQLGQELANVEYAQEHAKEALAAAEDEFDRAADAVASLEDQLSSAKAALDGFTRPNIEGMEEFEDKLFAIDMATKSINLNELTGQAIDTTWIDQLGDEIAAKFRAITDANEDGFISDEQMDFLRDYRSELELTRDLTYEPQVRELDNLVEGYKGVIEQTEALEAQKGALLDLFDTTGIIDYKNQADEIQSTIDGLDAATYTDALPFDALKNSLINLGEVEIPNLQTQLAAAKEELDVAEEAVQLHTDIVTSLEAMNISVQESMKQLKIDFGEATDVIVADAEAAIEKWEEVYRRKQRALELESAGVSSPVAAGVASGLSWYEADAAAHGAGTAPNIMIEVKNYLDGDEVSGKVEQKIGSKLLTQG